MFPSKTMSQSTQNEFKTLTGRSYGQYRGRLNLNHPSFHDEGYTTTAILSAAAGTVELSCGPAEYHVEVAIVMDAGRKRWELSRWSSHVDVALHAWQDH
jgi:hypothetical protein